MSDDDIFKLDLNYLTEEVFNVLAGTTKSISVTIINKKKLSKTDLRERERYFYKSVLLKDSYKLLSRTTVNILINSVFYLD